MNKEWKYRLAPLAALWFVTFASVIGCESKGPAERVGQASTRAFRRPKTHSTSGAAEKAGRALDSTVKP